MPGACMGHAAKLGAAVTGGAGVAGTLKQDPPLVRFICPACRRLSFGGHDWHTCHDCRLKAFRKVKRF
jgi:hypothetical protein